LQQRKRRDYTVPLIEMKIDCRLQRGETKLVAAQRAKHRLTFQRGDKFLFAGNDSRLRPAE